MTRPGRGVADRAPYPRLIVNNPPLPAWVPDRAPLRDDGNPARDIANAVLIGAAMWGIGFTIWWALVSGACGK